eukprot:TRINITY_DN326_c0_g1_i6.p2 TRINITY_DN326_c0_g1~~TRINITY_DN326_c0_g1_i6.p2  ORF type:complete len:131 (-),score=4.36 TRINITY_DN326_c0_g1_i6:278-670(-)
MCRILILSTIVVFLAYSLASVNAQPGAAIVLTDFSDRGLLDAAEFAVDEINKQLASGQLNFGKKISGVSGKEILYATVQIWAGTRYYIEFTGETYYVLNYEPYCCQQHDFAVEVLDKPGPGMELISVKLL